MSTPDSPRARYSHVDSLRGIAALLVVWLHVSEVFKRVPWVREQGDWLYRTAETVDVGRIGVVIFFAISGFVICPSLKGLPGITTRAFLIKRFFRLYPAYWLAIVLGSFASWQMYGNPLSAGLYAANATMIPTLFGYDNMMGLLWTLETELVFYVVCLLLFWSGTLHKPLALAITCFALLALFAAIKLRWVPAPALSTWRSMPYHLAIMFWGGIARYCFDDSSRSVNIGNFALRIPYLLVLVAAALLLPLLAFSVRDWMLTGKTKELTLTAAYSLAMAFFVIGVFRIRLQHPILVWLGTISYSLYLFHSIFFTPMFLWAAQHPDHPLARLHMGIYLAITMLATIVFSDLVYRLIEAPSNRLARRLTSHLQPTKGSPNV